MVPFQLLRGPENLPLRGKSASFVSLSRGKFGAEPVDGALKLPLQGCHLVVESTYAIVIFEAHDQDEVTIVTACGGGQKLSRIERTRVSRRGLLLGFGAVAAATASASATPGFASAPALLTGAGNYRSLALVNDRTGEWLKSVFWIEGEYVPEALSAFNHILRDWRESSVIEIDRRALDILSACHDLLDCSEPYTVVSGYRTQKTNNMLRRRARGVARNSYHTKGMAIDVAMKTRSVGQIAGAGLSLNRGGVGRYSRASFVHLDSGPVRSWGR